MKCFAYKHLLIAAEPLNTGGFHWPVTCSTKWHTIQDCFVFDCPGLRFLPTQFVKAVTAPRRPSLEEYRMKSLLRVLFVVALFCGVASHAHASVVDFHVQVLDPVNVCI